MTKKNQTSEDLLQIGDAAKKAGVSVQTVQNYIMLGLLNPAARTQGGRRLFDKQTIERIMLIRTMNKNGYTLRGIRELFAQRFGEKIQSNGKTT